MTLLLPCLVLPTGGPALYLPATRAKAIVAAAARGDADDVAQSDEHDLLLEVQAINATGDRQRSWFVGNDTVVGGS